MSDIYWMGCPEHAPPSREAAIAARLDEIPRYDRPAACHHLYDDCRYLLAQLQQARQELAENAAFMAEDREKLAWQGAITRELLPYQERAVQAEAALQQAREALQQIAAHELCEDKPSDCQQGSGPYCATHVGLDEDDLVNIARAALKAGRWVIRHCTFYNAQPEEDRP